MIYCYIEKYVQKYFIGNKTFHTKFQILRDAKFKTSLRVGFFLDFRNFIFASSAAARIKKYS